MDNLALLEDLKTRLNALDLGINEIYYKGALELLSKPKIAIVGSRRPSAYTKNLTLSLAAAVANSGGVVVSGGAMGVDCCAHMGAKNNTIAVFANSLDLYYPAVCKETIKNIYQNALAISTYAPTTYAKNYFFVERNKIVTGMSDAVVVAQAELKSGSMHSANFANAQNKPLFVLAQKMDESIGTNYLLHSNRAKIIYSIDEFLKDVGLKASISDEFLDLCKKTPDLNVLMKTNAAQIFEYELAGKIKIIDNKVIVL